MEETTVRTIVWTEIARQLSRENRSNNCICIGSDFCRFLLSFQNLPFPVLSIDDFRKTRGGEADLITGWNPAGGREGSAELRESHDLLTAEGEARFYGWYRFPTSDDILLWERKCGKGGIHLPVDWPPPNAGSIGEITALIKTSPFSRFSVRKRGIYYQAVLRKV